MAVDIRKYIFLVSIGVVLSLSSCDRSKNDDEVLKEVEKPVVSEEEEVKEEEETPAEEKNDYSGVSDYLKKYVSRIEVPALDENNLFIQHSTLEGNDSVMSYCFEFNREKLHSNWVAFRFDRITRARNTKRKDKFQDDPSLPEYLRISKSTFPGYDRGHICASADRLYSEYANEQTFYMSNMSPQIAQFNQKYWVKFESYVQTIGRDKQFSDTLYVVKGGTIADDMIIDRVVRPNGAEVVVPAYYYIALLKVKDGEYSSIAFWVEHKKYDHSGNKSDLQASVVTVDELESFTGIDFFHNLPDSIEREVESAFRLSSWNI